jgi:hypothetical protein
VLEANGSVTGDDVQLASSFEPISSYTLFLQHDAAGDFVFHDGVLCAGGTLIRCADGRPRRPGFVPNPCGTARSRSRSAAACSPARRAALLLGLVPQRLANLLPAATANVTNGVYVDW